MLRKTKGKIIFEKWGSRPRGHVIPLPCAASPKRSAGSPLGEDQHLILEQFPNLAAAGTGKAEESWSVTDFLPSVELMLIFFAVSSILLLCINACPSNAPGYVCGRSFQKSFLSPVYWHQKLPPSIQVLVVCISFQTLLMQKIKTFSSRICDASLPSQPAFRRGRIFRKAGACYQGTAGDVAGDGFSFLPQRALA